MARAMSVTLSMRPLRLRSLISLSSLVFSVCDISFMYLTINTKKVVSLFGDTIFVTIFVTLISDKYN